MSRRLLVLPLIAALSACARSSNETTSSLPVQPTTAVSAVGAGEGGTPAVVILPEGAGAVSAVREQNYSNGVVQQISLASEGKGLGENRIDISVQTVAGEQRVVNGVPIWKPSESGVKSEIINRMRGVQMSIVNREFQNAYGPFGLAIGKMSETARCIFAWQYISDVRLKVARSSTSPALIRIRLCQNNTTVDEMASYVQNMRIVPYDSFGSGRATATALTDVRGGGSQQAASGELDSLIPVRRGAAQPTQRAAAPAPAPRQSVRRAPAPARAVAERPEKKRDAGETVTLQAQPYYGANPYGQRYLAPVGGGMSGMSPMNMPTQSAPLSGDLPTQAYRGPSAAERAAAKKPANTAASPYQPQYQANAPSVPTPGDAMTTQSIRRGPPQSVYYTGPQIR